MIRSMMIKMMIMSSIILLSYSISIETKEKQIKINACFHILKERTKTINDLYYFNRLIDLFVNLGNEADKTQKVLFMTLCSCYNTIPFYSAEAILKQERLNSTAIDIKEYSSFEKWEELMMEKDQERISREITKVNSAFNEIKTLGLDISQLTTEFQSQSRIYSNFISNKLKTSNPLNLNDLSQYWNYIIVIGMISIVVGIILLNTLQKKKTDEDINVNDKKDS